jgi:endonuclease/exonuclease/phosphatase (EEP) superfamily protein YafD
MQALGWTAIVALIALSATQWVGFDAWRPLAVVQSLSPYALVCAVPVGVTAALSGEWTLAVTALVPIATLGWLIGPGVRARRRAGQGEPTVTVFFGNLLAWNERAGAAMDAVVSAAADVLVLTEFNSEMQVLLEARCGCRYPHRIEAIRDDPAGIAIWSTHPIDGVLVPLSDRPVIDASVDVHGTALRVIGVHTEPPTMRAKVWSRELADIGRMADSEAPTIIVGDFNAARWHPSFRRLLDEGWVSVHEWLGEWWRTSWPHEGHRLPMFVRLDHGLIRGPVAPVRVREVPLPGSDHRGFVVCLSLARR